MLEDLAALTPPLLMCVAFIIGVVWFLRREMAPRRGPDAKHTTDSVGGGVDEAGTTATITDISSPDEESATDAGQR